MEDSEPFSESSEIDLDEADYAAVLQVINEYLPVKEMAGKLIHVPELRQFGLVDNDKVDDFLAGVFAHEKEPPGYAANVPNHRRSRQARGTSHGEAQNRLI